MLFMKKFLQNFLLILCIGVFCFSAWKLFGIWQEYHAGDEIYDSIQKQVAVPPSDPVPDPDREKTNDTEKESESENPGYSVPDSLADLEALKKINPDAIGWIQIPDTNINYPILQTGNNQDYLRRTITGESNKAGCIFADYRSEKAFQSASTIVYGHNLLNGKMFSDLMKYEDQDWYGEHPFIYIQIPGKVQLYEIYSCYRTTNSSQTYTFGLETGTESYQEYLLYSIEQALYSTGIEPTDTDRILTLSTCTNESEVERFIVHARLIAE